jgi:hypothetical protein
MNTMREDEEEAGRDNSVIEGLARSQGVRSEDVRRLYESALARMKQGAVILDFLPIFAARKVKELLERKDGMDQFGDPETRKG